MKHLILPIILLCVSCTRLAAQDNPFERMAGKKYAQYSMELYDEYLKFIKLDTVEARKVITRIRKVAESTGSKAWELEAEYFEVVLFDIKRYHFGEEKYPAEKLLQLQSTLLEKVRKADLPPLELKVRHDMIDNYWNYIKNYGQAFELCNLQDKRLNEIPPAVAPKRAYYYIQIGNAYYRFKDYSRAMPYYEKILTETEIPINTHEHQAARNGLGLCYRYGFNDYDRSDSCFRSITDAEYLRPEDEAYRDNWNGIAEGNIGRNMFLRGRYDDAIPLLESSIGKVLRNNDYGYASGPAATLAEIYLKKGNPAEAKRYIDLAREYYDISPREGRLAQIYEATTKYYTAIGNPSLSMAYLDSTQSEKKKYDDSFNAMLLLRMEQKDSAQRQQELLQEKEKRQQAQLYAFILSIGCVLIGCLLALVLILYRRKRTAYRELVRRSQEWAQVEPKILAPVGQPNTAEPFEPDQETQNGLPDEADLSIMKDIERLMSEEKLYKDSALSVDSLAQALGTKRNYVSRAINRCTKKSFNTFVNEYRIKEAIRLLSEDTLQNFSIEGIAFDSGFNDRRNFHRVFSKITGLSPTAFRNNINGK